MTPPLLQQRRPTVLEEAEIDGACIKKEQDPFGSAGGAG